MAEVTSERSKDSDSDDDCGLFMADFFTKDLDIEDTFEYSYGDAIACRLKGVAKEYGQTTLGTGDGTGLTIWRGAEELCNYLWLKRAMVAGKRCLELGAGLGLVGLLVSHLRPSVCVVTDGDEATLDRLCSNFGLNDFAPDDASGRGLSWQESERVFNGLQSSRSSDGGGGGGDASPSPPRATIARLLWMNSGDMARAANLAPPGSHGYDLILAADVVYADEAVIPLVATVSELLSKEPTARWVLSFARRNVPVHRVITEAATKGWGSASAGITPTAEHLSLSLDILFLLLSQARLPPRD